MPHLDDLNSSGVHATSTNFHSHTSRRPREPACRPRAGWHLYDLGAVNILRVHEDPDAPVAVSVHFTAAGGGELPFGEGEQRPEGSAWSAL